MARPASHTRYEIDLKIGEELNVTLEAITGGAIVRTRSKALTGSGGIVTNAPYGPATCDFQCRLTTSQYNLLVSAYEGITLLPFGKNACVHKQYLYSGNPESFSIITTSFDHVTLTAMPDVAAFDADGADVFYNIGLSLIGGGAPLQEDM